MRAGSGEPGVNGVSSRDAGLGSVVPSGSGAEMGRGAHHDVFVCYATEDKPIADAVVGTLEAAEVRCWIAPRDVVPGDSYAEDIVAAIDGSRLVVFVFSAHSNESRHTSRELGHAVHAGIPIVPFRIEAVTPSPTLEFFISGAHWLDAMTPPLKAHLRHLAVTTRMLLGFEDPEQLPHELPVVSVVAGSAGLGGFVRAHLRWVVAAVGLVVILAAVVSLLVTRSEGDGTGASLPDDVSVTDTIDIEGSPSGMAVSADAVWVTSSSDDTVSRIDPDERIVTDTVGVGDAPSGVAVSGDAVWVTDGGEGTVSRIDVDERTVTDTVDVDGGADGIASSGDAVWVTSPENNTVSRIDVDSHNVTDTIEVGSEPRGVAASDDSVWVTSLQNNTVSRIDVDSRTVTDTINMRFAPLAVVVGHDAVWVTDVLDRTVSRIG